MKIQVLGPGCPKCNRTAENAERAVRELGIQAEVEKVQELSEMMKFSIMLTPGLAIDGEVKSSGKELSVEEIKALLSGNPKA
jgi:small redox-active disulfide protein 2